MQATKEAEHREKLVELRAKIDDCKQKYSAADESQRLHKVHCSGSLLNAARICKLSMACLSLRSADA